MHKRGHIREGVTHMRDHRDPRSCHGDIFFSISQSKRITQHTSLHYYCYSCNIQEYCDEDAESLQMYACTRDG